jgi:hypothetical protein
MRASLGQEHHQILFFHSDHVKLRKYFEYKIKLTPKRWPPCDSNTNKFYYFIQFMSHCEDILNTKKFDSERGAVRLRPVEHRAFVRISSTVNVGGVLVEDALAALGMNG